MKKVKRLAALLLALAMLAACSAGESSPAAVQEESSSTVTEELAAESTEDVYSADVIVVGAGGAGMAAAIEAAGAGASVIVLEKSAIVGGNTTPAQSGINAVGSAVMEALEIEGTMEDFMEQHLNELNDEALVQAMADESAGAIDFLIELGLEFTIRENSPFTHRVADGSAIGPAVVDVLYGGLVKSGATVLFNMEATELIMEGGEVAGVMAKDAAGETLAFMASAVVLATGGYGQDNALVAQYAPRLLGAGTDEIAPTTGDGLLMAQAIGAAAVDLGEIQTFPSVEVTTHSMIFPNLIMNDCIYVNSEGLRFVREQWGGEEMLAAVMQENTNGGVWVVFDSEHFESTAALQDFYDRGLIAEGETVEGLAAAIGVSAENLAATVAQWNEDFATGEDSVFGRDSNMENDLSHAPYYAIPFNVGVHYCRGGLVIDTAARVLDEEGNAIPGLYAGGEVTGGVHGAERVDGTAVTDTIVFGRLSGSEAAGYALAKGSVALVAPESGSQAVPAASGDFEDGVYEGTGVGREGDITVQVTVENGSITEIAVVESGETPAIFMGVENELIPAIVRTQSLEVDNVAGATLSSDGVLDAVADALGLAR